MEQAAIKREGKLFKGHDAAISSLLFHPDGKHFLSGSYDDTVKLWDIANAAIVREFKGHTSWIRQVCLSPDGTQILTCSIDMTFRVWDFHSGKEEYKHTGQSSVQSVAYDPATGNILVGYENGRVSLWNLESRKEIIVYGEHMTGAIYVAVSPSGQYTAAAIHNVVHVWEKSSGEQVMRIENRARIRALHFLKNDSQILVSGEDGTVKLWNFIDKREDARFAAKNKWINGFTLAQDEQTLALVSDEWKDQKETLMTVRIYSFGNPDKPIKECYLAGGHKTSISTATFSSDLTSLLTGGNDHNIYLWQL
ncbi:MAG: WD40 repeat domain-containing protein [Acidobacteriota bacterium]|nr:WD40 repeat domain-containing protein [Blastocatellia bacterium]MDW8412033.1 WD40 repeat domain-containing protein [Acidobacteriota bacterium]